MHRAFNACLVIAACVLAGPARAESDAQMQRLVDDVRELVEKGERERLADPWFLKDLRALLSRYDNPWRSRILIDDFSARGPEPAPPWQVLSGEFLIDWRHGLRAVVDERATAPPQQQRDKRSEKQDVAAALIGAIVQQAISGNQDQAGNTTEPVQEDRGFATSSTEPASVVAPVRIPNAFSIKMELSARPLAARAPARLEIGIYQGRSTEVGYRLIHQSGATPSFTLISASGRRVATVDLTDRPIDLRDNTPHSLEWSRDGRGRMQVSLDGTALMQVSDRRFKDPFDGLVVVNAAGDFALRKVEVHGAR